MLFCVSFISSGPSFSLKPEIKEDLQIRYNGQLVRPPDRLPVGFLRLQVVYSPLADSQQASHVCRHLPYSQPFILRLFIWSGSFPFLSEFQGKVARVQFLVVLWERAFLEIGGKLT